MLLLEQPYTHTHTCTTKKCWANSNGLGNHYKYTLLVLNKVESYSFLQVFSFSIYLSCDNCQTHPHTQCKKWRVMVRWWPWSSFCPFNLNAHFQLKVHAWNCLQSLFAQVRCICWMALFIFHVSSWHVLSYECMVFVTLFVFMKLAQCVFRMCSLLVV